MIGHLYTVLLARNADEKPDADAARENMGGRGWRKADQDIHGAAAAVLTIIALVASGELDE